MSRLASERVRALEAYQPGEQPTGGGLLKLNTNENPHPPSPRVAEAVARAAADGLNLYPPPMADALRETAAGRYAVRAGQVLVGNGSDELLAICLRACVTEGDPVAYVVPSYSLYRTLVAIAGAHSVEIAAPPGSIPPALEEANARVTFVCSPNSPYGAVVPGAEIVALARAVDGLVVVDEAYVDFADVTALELLDAHPNLLVVRSFSKSFSLAGLRLGLAFGDEAVIGDLAKVKDSYNVSRLALAAGVAALDDYDWMKANVARVRATRERVAAALRTGGFRVPDSHANFIWVDCGVAGGGRVVFERLRSAGILVRYFDTPALQAGVRVTIGTDEQMDRFLQVVTKRP